MKVRTPDWKSAWFENHISDRFFQEMSKVDKGVALNMETVSQWMAQVMSDAGMLAQALAVLDEESPPANRIRMAADRALRLAAISMHLMTVLDQSQRNGENQSRPFPGNFAPPEKPRPFPGNSAPPARQPQPRPPQGAPEQEFLYTAAPDQRDAGTSHRPEDSTGAGRPLQKSVALGTSAWMARHAASQGTHDHDPAEDRFHGQPAHDAADRSADNNSAPFLSPFLRSDEQGRLTGNKNEIHQTILSLVQRGLAIAEIEAITGQPRHIVEAVIHNS
ncbi:MAG: hypothetical protein OEZ59_07730 [Deltaproteobacteria bacterium]|nr:hypothetical protein [Deltaproteobacteria bacterium]